MMSSIQNFTGPPLFPRSWVDDPVGYDLPLSAALHLGQQLARVGVVIAGSERERTRQSSRRVVRQAVRRLDDLVARQARPGPLEDVDRQRGSGVTPLEERVG